MKRKWALFLSIGILLLSLLFWIYKRAPSEKPPPYFSLYVDMFGRGSIPYFNVEIDGKTFLLCLDLGHNGDLTLQRQYLAEITNKSFIETTTMSGVRGNKYTIDVYQIPEAKIQGATLCRPQLEEAHSAFDQETVLIPATDPSTPEAVGSLGWKLFRNVTLFLNLAKGEIVLGRNIEALREKGYKLEEFTETPLQLNHDLLVIEATTPQGLWHCLLDTGCTSNLLNESESDKPIETMIQDESNFVNLPSFAINNTNFGPITFRPVPMKLPFHIDAVLGLEFFFKHQVIIDFEKQSVFIRALSPVSAKTDH